MKLATALRTGTSTYVVAKGGDAETVPGGHENPGTALPTGLPAMATRP